LRSNGKGDREAVEGLVASDPIIYQRAARMRRHMTPPEARLWRGLKGHKLNGLKFRRQHSAHDRRREAWLEARGVTPVRYPALSSRDNLDGVLAGIQAAAGGR